MTNEDAARRLDEVEALALRAREEGRELSPWVVIQVCEGRVHVQGSVPPLPHDRPDLQERGH
jgi:hypothetical protein